MLEFILYSEVCNSRVENYKIYIEIKSDMKLHVKR